MNLLETLAPAVRDAGRLIERVRADGIGHRLKSDRSPVTIADEQAEALLLSAIRAADPDTLIVGEEHSDRHGLPAPADRFWLVDPLDGTADFVAGRFDYTVNVALVADGRPVLGLVLHPPSQTLWAGEVGAGAWRAGSDADAGAGAGTGRGPIRVRPWPERPVAVVSHSHLDPDTVDWLGRLGEHERLAVGSSLKFVRVAEGAADIYPRFGPTMEWDTAAGQAVLEAAGGRVEDADGRCFSYGKPGWRNGPFIARGS